MQELIEIHGRRFITGLLFVVGQAYFLITPKTTSPEVGLYTLNWSLEDKLIIKKMPHKLSVRKKFFH